MRILLGSNVVIDFFEDREPFFEESARVIERVEQGVVTGLLCATTLTTIAYLAGKTLGKKHAVEQMRQLLTLFEVAPVNRSILDAALAGNMPDFEDAVLAQAAHQAGAQAIITRNLKDFAHSLDRFGFHLSAAQHERSRVEICLTLAKHPLRAAPCPELPELPEFQECGVSLSSKRLCSRPHANAAHPSDLATLSHYHHASMLKN